MPHYVGHDLDETTQLYVDVHVALEIFHMRYPTYIAQTTPVERQLYNLYLALKSQKEKHLEWHAEHDGKATQLVQDDFQKVVDTSMRQ